ncbi:hypothetical protein V8G54_018875 [Vigna mungo]|uniref:Uncharacterized protein n=1 Tax=Vigna mungo TaxID=3915 RepID=A0AAQ3RRV9_VIGMU
MLILAKTLPMRHLSLSTLSKEKMATLEFHSLLPPIIDKKTHLFYRLLMTKRSTFLPSHKKKCNNLSTPSKGKRYDPKVTKYNKKTYLNLYAISQKKNVITFLPPQKRKDTTS